MRLAIRILEGEVGCLSRRRRCILRGHGRGCCEETRHRNHCCGKAKVHGRVSSAEDVAHTTSFSQACFGFPFSVHRM